MFKKSNSSHFGVLKEMVRGRNINTFLSRNKISFTFNKEMKTNFGCYYESFEIGGINERQPFFTNEAFEKLIESSYRSLHNLSLNSCYLLIEKSFNLIPKAVHLIKLSLVNMGNLTDNCVIEILKSC